MGTPTPGLIRRNYYKVLGDGGVALHGGAGTWYLPDGNLPGNWMPSVAGELIPCKNGYHLCERGDLIQWLGPVIFEAEFRGDHVREDNKTVVRRARLLKRLDTWNERTARLFACDCAEHVLHYFEERHPKDMRPRQAIEIARRFAIGEGGLGGFGAAWWAADSAAYSVADWAAYSAARAAAYSAASSEAGLADWSEADWAAYSAAGSAARWAAYSAAGSAADSVADWAARWAASSAEGKWQTDRLFEYLDGEAP